MPLPDPVDPQRMSGPEAQNVYDVIGVEMAGAWQGLGSSVTLLAQADGLLPRMFCPALRTRPQSR
jgi:hypothetical protein